MATQDDTTPPRYDSLHELLARAQQLHLTATLTVHGVPTEELLGWLQAGLLDAIEPGASGNPPTGRMASGDWLTGKAEAACFMEDGAEKVRRIKREHSVISELAAALDEKEEQS